MPSTIIAPPVEPPKKIGRYIIERELGRGGFGIVFRAWDPELEQHVAIKIPRRDTGLTSEALKRFAREAKSAARLKHPGIVRVLTVEYDGDVPFIVSGYIDGLTLSDRLKAQPPLSFEESARIVKGVAEAVAYAHSEQVIHRDIKPSNVIIAAKDGIPRLLDFGLARREAIDETLTPNDQMLGTPAYMSPEQARGNANKVDYRTDIYSLGVMLYQVLTGEVPFHGDYQMILRQVIQDEPRRPSSIKAGVPLDLETICERAMVKEADQRLQKADKLADELDRWLRKVPIESRPITRLERGWRWCRRNPLTSSLVGSIAALLALCALGATGMYASEHRRLTEKEQLLAEKSEMLSKSYVKEANRYLGPPAEQQEFSPMKALPWLYAAMENDQHNPQRWEASRIRLGAALRQLPSVERVWSHKGGIFVAAVSPTGDRFVTGNQEGTAYVWDLSKDDPVTPALVHPGGVTGVAFTSDGKSVATGCADGALRLWDAATGKLIHGPFWDNEFAKSSSSSNAVFINVDHQSVLTVRLTSAQLWNTATGEPIGKTLTVPSDSSNLPADSGSLILSANANAVIAWDAQTGKEKQRLDDKGKLSNIVATAPDGVTVAMADTSRCVRFWNCHTGKTFAVTAPHSNSVTALKFSPDGNLLASGTENGTVHLWKSSDGSLVGQRQLFSARITSLDFTSDAHQLAATARHHGMVSIAGLDNSAPACQPIHIPGYVHPSRWIAAKETLLTVSEEGSVRLWKPKPQQAAFQLAHAAPISGVAVSKDRQTLASIDSDGNCSIAGLGGTDGNPNQPAGRPIPTGMFDPVVAVTSDGSKFATADLRGAVALWEVAGRKKIRDLDAGAPQKRRVYPSDVRLAFTGDDRLLIYVMNRWKERFCEISAWDVKTGERVQYQRFESDAGLGDFDLQVGGSNCAVAVGRRLIAWDAATGQHAGPIMLHDGDVTSSRLSPDGTQVISGCNDGVARVWNVRTGKVVAATVKHPKPVLSIAYCADGLRFATGCYDGTARIWSMSNAAALIPPLAQGAEVTGCKFSSNSRWLLTTSGDALSSIPSESILRVWDATTGEPLFGLPLSFLDRQPTARFRSDPHRPSQLELICLSSDNRLLHFMIHGGLVDTLSLEPDARGAHDLLREIVIRSGVQPDGTGGLSIVDPDRLTRVFRRQLD
jgi:serine/threonine protein kinase/WD40 repeat protein